MSKRISVDGKAIRRERLKRALTQEELAERASLGIRTLRRLEAGYATLDTMKRVRQVLETAPEVETVDQHVPRQREMLDALYHEPLTLILSTGFMPLFRPIAERIGDVRKHIAREVGIALPGVRMQDDTRLEEGAYRILIQGKTVGRDRVRREGWLVVAPEHDLESLKGERCEDPTYGMPAVWMEERPDPEIYSLCFDPVSVICTHLTERIKAHAAELLGVDEVEALLSGLGRPTLVKLVTERFSVVLLRRVLKNLLRERLTIRPLPLILETLLDCPEGAGEETLTERARAALGWFTCQELANPQGEINAIVFEPGYQREILNAWEKESSAIFKKVQRVVLEVHADGRNAVIVVDPDLRPGLAKKLRDPNVSVLSTEEIDPAFRVLPWRVLERVED